MTEALLTNIDLAQDNQQLLMKHAMQQSVVATKFQMWVVRHSVRNHYEFNSEFQLSLVV